MSRGEESMSKKDFFPIKTVLWANKKQKNRFLVILNQIENQIGYIYYFRNPFRLGSSSPPSVFSLDLFSTK